VFLGDLTFIDVAASSVATSSSHRENSSWDSQGRQDRMNNILRIIANFQQSNYCKLSIDLFSFFVLLCVCVCVCALLLSLLSFFL
ncbi:unnamed protein product, partial [Trichobilharzia regenti]